MRKFKLVVALDVVDWATGDEANCGATITSKKMNPVKQNILLLKGSHFVCTVCLLRRTLLIFKMGALLGVKFRPLLLQTAIHVKKRFVHEAGKVPSCCLVPILYFFNEVQKLVISQLGRPGSATSFWPPLHLQSTPINTRHSSYSFI